MVSLVIVIALLSQFSSSRLQFKRNADDGLTERISSWKRAALLLVAIAAGTAFASLALIGLSTATVASAATTGAPAVAQCNPPDFPITAGLQVTCTVTVVNTTSSSGATSSTVTTSACLAAAGVRIPLLSPESRASHQHDILNQLVTSVNQCNGI